MLPFLHRNDPFPPSSAARQDLGGILAAGGGLGPDRLLTAYRQGLFPWGTLEGHPLWYCPDPRMVLFPEDFRLHRSLRQRLCKTDYTVKIDHDFPAVINACARIPRPGQDGTWISNDMQEAYIRLHELGWAHSIEVYIDRHLCGGLYGLAIGRAFFGESMFSRCTDGSKIAFAHLVRFLREQGFGMIDCQMHTRHLASLGAREIPMAQFLEHLGQLTVRDDLRGPWPSMDRIDW